MPRIVFVLSQHMLATSATWPADMISAANQAAKAMAPNSPSCEMVTVSVNDASITPNAPFCIQPAYKLEDITEADLIYLPALWRNPYPIMKSSRSLIPWLQHHANNGTIISGAGTGCCFMAEAGLLNHKPATTHWYYFDQFQKRYPLVQLKRQHFITQASNLYCAASINSFADLTVHFIQKFFNKSVAQHVERHFSHEARRSYEIISYLEGGNINHSDEEILQIQLWIKNNHNQTISVENVAQQFSMSQRNLTRRFKEATGKTLISYMQDLRINTACDLLQFSNLSIGNIADKVGYNDASHFTQIFRKKLHISPREYRTTVRAKLFHEE